MAEKNDQQPDRQEVGAEVEFDRIDDAEILQNYEAARAERDHWSAAAGNYEAEIMRRIRERGGTAIPSNDYICELAQSVSYDQLRFAPLKEILNETDLSSCLIPAHVEQVPVPEKWTTVKVKALARRYGPVAQRIVDQAAIPGNVKLQFSRRTTTGARPADQPEAPTAPARDELPF